MVMLAEGNSRSCTMQPERWFLSGSIGGVAAKLASIKRWRSSNIQSLAGGQLENRFRNFPAFIVRMIREMTFST